MRSQLAGFKPRGFPCSLVYEPARLGRASCLLAHYARSCASQRRCSASLPAALL